jgi:hypothetical protein
MVTECGWLQWLGVVVLGLDFKTRVENVKKVIEDVVDIAPVRWPPITSRFLSTSQCVRSLAHCNLVLSLLTFSSILAAGLLRERGS